MKCNEDDNDDDGDVMYEFIAQPSYTPTKLCSRGPPGHGKTAFAEALAEEIIDKSDRVSKSVVQLIKNCVKVVMSLSNLRMSWSLSLSNLDSGESIVCIDELVGTNELSFKTQKLSDMTGARDFKTVQTFLEKVEDPLPV
ncbi:hypothetical protein BC332_31716 [Capsicum chinense]|nr:hypothetical protein BC332_31716 [Capsicum chinense]